MDGGLLHYINPAHAISLLSALNEERMKEQLCDVILIVGDQKFRAHKNILAASSEYFHSLFTNKNNDSQTVFQLDFCEADAFENVLSYIYSSSLFVEKGSLAAVQEMGYSLGITFLTNILSKTPQAPFSPCPQKKAAFSEDEENGSQQRSVIVCQSQNEAKDVGRAPHDMSSSSKPSASSSSQGRSTSAKQHLRSADTLNSLYSKRNWRVSSNDSDDSNVGGWMKRNAQKKTFPADPAEDQQAASMHLIRGNTSEAFKKKMAHVPALLSPTDSPYPMQKPGKDITVKQEDRNLHYYSQLGAAAPSAAPGKQTIDRSGPLVKSLLRRSLSMDSEVPSYSHDADFQASQGGPSIEDASKDDAPEGCSRRTLLKRARDAAHDKNADRGKSFASTLPSSRDSFQNDNIQIKTEPQSPPPPPSEPAEIIRVTVGDAAEASNCDVAVKMEETPEASSPPPKRRFHSDRRMLASRRAKAKANTSPEPETNFDRRPSHLEGDFYDSDDSKEMCIDTQEVGQARKFKCKHCLKIFRSTAGLNRHINMYHNPEKPYACDICNKRFHTNFKVWTHCQTQHGIVKNPSPASSAHGVLDEKFQRKLIDIVREREIKKALMYKLRRGKQGYQGPSGSQAQAMKRNLRSRSKAAYVCSYCGKSYRFLSQLKQHAKMHPVDKAALSKNIRPKKSSSPKSPVESKELFHCRLCNATLSSFAEQGNHERMCRNATLCPYCSLRFSSPELKTEHEAKCEYKKLTCLECMRTFKSSFSIWRHQVEVHNQNTMAPTENLSLPLLNHNGETSKAARRQLLLESRKVNSLPMPKDDPDAYSDSSEQMNFDSDDSNCLPEDLSMSKRFNAQIKEEPADDMEDEPDSSYVHKEATSDSEGGMWSCEKCGKIFTVHKQLERHQELLCSVKPFICHVCNKAFRTNFRLWSHFQSHMAQGEEASFRESDACAPVSSPSPPPLPPPPPPLPKIQPIEPETTASYPEKHSPPEKKFAPQESETLFYHAPPLSAITFKRQFMCKLCHRTFKTAFSLWSHEQTHN